MANLPQRLQTRSNVPLAIMALASALLLSGCGVSDLTEVACQYSGDDPHCAQEAAVQSGDADNCDNVAQKEEFKKIGSNPPRDKCVVMVAANNEDPAKCDNINGGLRSYTKEDCLKAISDTARDPQTCSKLPNTDLGSCINNMAQKTFDDIDKLKDMKIKTKQDQQVLQQRMRDLEKMTEMLNSMNKSRMDMEKSAISNLRG